MQKRGATSTALLIFFLLYSTAVLSDQLKTSITVTGDPSEDVSQSPKDPAVPSTDPRSTMETFVPEKDWKEIKDGQAIPPGLHVRMNFQTGINEAKLMESEQTPSSNTALSVSMDENQLEEERDDAKTLETGRTFLRSELEEALKKIDKGDDVLNADDIPDEEKSKVRQKFRSMEELRKDFESLNMQIKTDREILKDLIEQYNAKSSLVTEEAAEKLTFLQDMEYYVHQIDNAGDFLDMGGLGLLKGALNETSPVLRAEAAHVLGSSAQSNPKAQIQLLNGGVLEILLSTIVTLTGQPTNPATDIVLSRSLYALSALLRYFPAAQKRLIDAGGVKIFEAVLLNTKLPRSTHKKVIRLVADLLVERNDTRKACENPATIDREIQVERLRQYNETSLEDALVKHWPSLLTDDFLDVKDHETTQSVLKIVRLLQQWSPYTIGKQILRNIETLRGHYSDHYGVSIASDVENNEDSAVAELYSLCLRILDVII